MLSYSPSVARVTTFLAIALICMSTSALGASTPLLPDDEVQALKIVGEKLGKKWNVSVDPCSGQYGWATSEKDNITCNCSFMDNSVCHVVSIYLKSQSLPGTLPKELVQLPYLQTFDVDRNYLNGTIPSEWSSMPNLQIISLSSNRLSGAVPKELGNISTLTILSLAGNQLSGVLPSELGNLTNLQHLWLDSNNFTGGLPTTFAKLTSLTQMWLSDNQFTGRIPDLIENWTNINKLAIQGSGMQGPIPSGIATLKNLTDLRISDLNGTEAPFPDLSKNLNMSMLILRSCNLTGELPPYVGTMKHLNILDVSFNKLTGKLPTNLENLATKGYKFLTGNQLNGAVPDWISSKAKNIDISYNNFTTDPVPAVCSSDDVNMFASSSKDNTSGFVTCLSDRHCSKFYNNLHINCGGGEVTIGDVKYDDDSDPGGPSNFFSNNTYHWVYSNTGYFTDVNVKVNDYTLTNTSNLSINDPRLYMNARISAISLTYYAFCLMNGKYTLKLHFAEINITNGQNYSSLGRRIFDVYIQGKRELKDFNIVAEAGGAGKEIVKKFTVMVTDSTLDIRFYWAGKGTTAIPTRGVYGPLISAISLNSNFKPPKELSTSALVGIVVAIVCFVSLIVAILYWQRCLRHKAMMDRDLKGVDLKTGHFTLRQIKAATNNFDLANKIGQGGFGSVYKGLLLDGTIIAVKQLSSKSNQGNHEFVNEIGMVSALQHPHLVKLYGCCVEGNQLLLVYEYMENNSLARALFGPEELQLKLDWPTRHRICIGIARGLAYLHEESRLKIVHRDIKATNVLLDKDLIAKISDFGLAKLVEEDNTHISTRIAGTFGYMAPEYAMRGYLTDKADVYSFGIVALEIICGKCNTSSKQNDECFYLLDWANMLKEKGDLVELVDSRLNSNFNKEEAMAMINVALLCTNVSPEVRPTMSSVVSMLEGKIKVEAPQAQAAVTIDEAKLIAMRKHFRGSLDEKGGEKVTQSLQMEGPQTTSLASVNDLYPPNLDSDYLLHRD